MFGQNPIRPILRDPLNLAVEEIFYTIQGEGPQAGRPCLFIRLAGCNLACTFCDTQFDSRAEMPQSIGEVMEAVSAWMPAQRRLVVLTGGEPMRQDWTKLAEWLLGTGTELIQIETAGTCWQDGLTNFVEEGKIQIVCSPKTGGVHREVARLCRHWKYVVRGGEVDHWDGLPNRAVQQANEGKLMTIYRPWPTKALDYDQAGRELGFTIWVSPCDDQDVELNRVNLELARDLCLQHGYRLSLQTHKLIGVA